MSTPRGPDPPSMSPNRNRRPPTNHINSTPAIPSKPKLTMDTSKAADPRRPSLANNQLDSAQLANGQHESPVCPSSLGSPGSAAMSTDSEVGIRIRGTANLAEPGIHEIANTTASDVRGIAKADSNSDMVQSLDQFADHVASFSVLLGQRDQAARRAEIKALELQKAKSRHAQYPSLTLYEQRSQQAASSSLTSLEKRLQEHLQRRRELLQAMAVGMASSLSQKDEMNAMRDDMRNELRNEMRNELQQVKLEIQDQVEKAKQEAAQARSESHQMGLEIQRMDRVILHTHSQQEVGISAAKKEGYQTNLQLKSLQDKVNTVSKSVEDNAVALSSIKSNHGELEQRIQPRLDLIPKISDTLSRHDFLLHQLDAIPKINDTLSQHGSLLNQFGAVTDTVKTTVKDLNARLENAESTPTPNPRLKTLQSDLQDLVEQIQDLRSTQEMKDELVSTELENTQNAANGNQKDLETVRSNLAILRSDMVKLAKSTEKSQSTPTPPVPLPEQHLGSAIASNTEFLQLTHNFHAMKQAVDAMKQTVDSHSNRLANHHVGLHSLESRYNNLSTEPLVRQMAAVMQDMYPFANEAQEVIKKIKTEILQLSQKHGSNAEDFDKRINQISGKLDMMFENQAVQLGKVQEQMQPLGDIASRVETVEKAQETAEKDKENMIISMNKERGLLKNDIESIDLRIHEVDGKIDTVETTSSNTVGAALAKIDKIYSKLRQFLRMAGHSSSNETSEYEDFEDVSSVDSSERTSESSVEVALAKTRTGAGTGTRPGIGEPRRSSSTPNPRMTSAPPLKRKAPSDHNSSSGSHSSRALSQKPSLDHSHNSERKRQKKMKRTHLA